MMARLAETFMEHPVAVRDLTRLCEQRIADIVVWKKTVQLTPDMVVRLRRALGDT